MSWSRCQLSVRDPQIFLLLPLLARPHRHAPILQTKPVDTSTLSVHESKLAPRAAKDFVGREAYLGRLQEMLTAEPGRFLLHGEPGTGKSMLALRFAWDAQKDFDAVVYQMCGDRALDEITAELADRLPIDVKTRPPEEKRKQSMQWLRERQSLLVLDDIWGRDAKQLEPGPPCSVLYTSRQPSLPWVSAKQSLGVESFREEEAEQLFHAYLDMTFGEDEVTRRREALLGFARRVQMLPIAVAVSAGLLRQKSASRLDRSVLRLRLDDLSDGVRDVPQLFQKAIASQPEREQTLVQHHARDDGCGGREKSRCSNFSSKTRFAARGERHRF